MLLCSIFYIFGGGDAMIADSIERMNLSGAILALLLHSTYRSDGIQFFTPDDFSQQFAYMNRSDGYVI